MDARSLARTQALGRLAFGAGLVAAPGVIAGAWVGGVADRREAQALSIGMGARDVAIAVGLLRALRTRRGARAWIRAGIAADAADLFATLRARDSLPLLALPGVSAMAASSVLLGAWLQRAVD